MLLLVPIETHQHYYPMLFLIDHTVGLPPARLADDPAAPRLEIRARELVAEYWSDTAWLTGMVSEVGLRFVRMILEAEGRALNEPGSSSLAIELLPAGQPCGDGG